MNPFTYLTIVSTILVILRAMIDLGLKRKWIPAGVAEALNKSLQESDDAIARAKAARHIVRSNNERDPDSVLRDDDGFRRPGD